MPRAIAAATALIALFLFAVPAHAQDETPAEVQPSIGGAVEPDAGPGDAVPADGPLVIATRNAPPFAFVGPDGEWTGIAIEMLAALADELDLAYTLEEASLKDMIAGTGDGRYAAAVAALSITPEREERVDFTHAYYSTGLGIAIDPAADAGWLQVLSNFFSWEFLVVLAGLAAVLLGAGVAVWFFERRGNNEEFSRNPVKGVGDGFWWAAVTMTTVGYGDKSPRTFGGRLIGLVWMFTAMIIVASFTAAIAASLTVGKLGGRIAGVGDLADVRVGVVAGTTGAAELAERRIAAREFAGVAEGFEALRADRIDAFVHDQPLLRYVALTDYEGEIEVLDEPVGRQDYGIALPPGSELREPLNRAMLAFVRSPEWARLTGSYLEDVD